MNAFSEHTEIDHTEQHTEEHYVKGEAFDHTVKHSDAFYEEYIASFEQNPHKRLFYRFTKRAFDLLASTLMLILLAPVFAVVAILIKCDSKGPVIFRQERMGKDAKPFVCLKFRSMRIDAPKNCATSLLANPDQYLTRIGRFLRKTSLDELPQLWCVFIGKMSFIGYRPLILNESNCNEMRRRLGVFVMRPGISGYAQVHGRDDLYYKNKAILDAEYVKRASLWFDLKLIFHTVAVVFSHEGNADDKKEGK